MNNASGRDCLFGFYEAVNTEAYFMALTDLLVTADGQYWVIMAWPSICAWCCQSDPQALAEDASFCLVCKVFSPYLDVFLFCL